MFVPHAAERWADAVLRAVDSPTDIRTLSDWSRQLGVSESQLRGVCDAASMASKASLDFARLLRAFVLARRLAWDLSNILDADPRTIRALFQRAGFAASGFGSPLPEVATFLDQQVLVAEGEPLAAVRRRLEGLGDALFTAEGR